MVQWGPHRCWGRDLASHPKRPLRTRAAALTLRTLQMDYQKAAYERASGTPARPARAVPAAGGGCRARDVVNVCAGVKVALVLRGARRH